MDDATLIRALGGQRHVARTLDVHWRTVSMWIFRNSIPAEHQVAVWKLAKQRGLDWKPPGAGDAELLLPDEDRAA